LGQFNSVSSLPSPGIPPPLHKGEEAITGTFWPLEHIQGNGRSFILCHTICLTTNNKSWIWEWHTNEDNEVMPQLNQSAYEAQPVVIQLLES